MDLFDINGGKYLVCVDKYSGMPLYERIPGEDTHNVVTMLEKFFVWFGWSEVIRADSGSCF